MITGDKPLTAIHVTKDVEIADRDALILDLKENPKHEADRDVILHTDFVSLDLEWRNVEETLNIPVDPSQLIAN